jgi:hypothetical protein
MKNPPASTPRIYRVMILTLVVLALWFPGRVTAWPQVGASKPGKRI